MSFYESRFYTLLQQEDETRRNSGWSGNREYVPAFSLPAPQYGLNVPAPSKPALFAPDYDGDGVSSWWEWGIDGMLYAADFAFGGPTGESLVAKGALTGITKGVGKTATKTAVKKGGIKVSFKAVDAKLLSKHGIKNIHTFKAEYLGNVDGSLFDVVKATSSGELLIIRKSTQQIE